MRRVPLDTEKRSQHSGPTWGTTLVVRGARDPLVPQEWAERVHRLVPKSQFVTVQGAGHALNFNSPEHLMCFIRSFLAGASHSEEMKRAESTRRMKQCHQRPERRRRMKEQEIMHRASSEMPRASISQYCAVMIANPTSGSYARSAHDVEETMAFLQQAGWQVDLQLTQAAGDGRRLAREAVAQKADVVIAVGGDGTINEVIQELAGSETALGVLPIGTVNVWAREMEIPLDSAGAREVLLHGTTRRVDLGRINDRHFLLMVGIGFDGEVAHTVEKTRFKRFGVLGYLLTTLRMSLRFQGFRVALTIDKHEVRTRALQIVIGNTQLYGGAITFTWHAKCDDGLLDVCIVHPGSRWRHLLLLLDLLLQRKQERQLVSYETCTSLEIRTRRPIALQVDGDAAGQTPATIQVVPGALKVIVPQAKPEGIFQKEREMDD